MTEDSTSLRDARSGRPPATVAAHGRPATSHWLGLIGLRRNYPAVRWLDGVRYVDDGEVITSAGVLSGVGGALRVVERMIGQAAAARAVAWAGLLAGHGGTDPAVTAGARRRSGAAQRRLPVGPPEHGVLLTEGVGRPSWPLFFATGARHHRGKAARGPLRAVAIVIVTALQ